MDIFCQFGIVKLDATAGERRGAYAEYISCPRTGRSYWANIFEFDLTLLKRKVSS